MENNTDIQIQMLSVETARNAITRAYAPWDPQVQASFIDQKSTTPIHRRPRRSAPSTVVSLQPTRQLCLFPNPPHRHRILGFVFGCEEHDE